MKKRFIQEGFKHSKKGSLHKELHFQTNEKIPEEVLKHIVGTKIGNHCIVYGNTIKVTTRLKRQANFLLNVDRLHRR